MNSHTSLVEAGKNKIAIGADRIQVLKLLENAGLPIIDSIKAVRDIYGMPLGEAKELCASSGLWNKQVDAAKPLHDDLERLFSE